MAKFLGNLAPVKWLSQDYCLGRALGNTDTASLALVSRYTDGTACVQIRHVVRTYPQAGEAGGALVLKQDFHAHTAPQAPSCFIDSLFPAINKLNCLEVFCPA